MTGSEFAETLKGLEEVGKLAKANIGEISSSGELAKSHQVRDKIGKAGGKIQETFTSLKDRVVKKEPKPAKTPKPPKPEKEIPEFEPKPITIGWVGEPESLAKVREKYVHTYQKEVFDKYHQKGKIDRVLIRIPFNQTYKEKNWTPALQKAKDDYEKALADYGQQLIDEGKETAEVFERLIVDEEQYLQKERLESYPQEEKGVIGRCLNKGLEKWRQMPAWKRALVSTAIGTVGLALGTAVGTGGLALGGVAITGYALKRFTGTMVAYYLTTPASGAIAGFVSKISSKKIEAGKGEKTTEIIEKIGSKTIDFEKAMKRYQEAKSQADKKEMRNKLITQGGVLAMGLAAGMGSSILLSDLFSHTALAADATGAKISTAESATVPKGKGIWERIWPFGDKGKVADQNYVNKKLPLKEWADTPAKAKIEDFTKKGIFSEKEVNELAKLKGAFSSDDVDRIGLYDPKSKLELDQFLKEKKYPDEYKNWFKVEDNGTIKGADNSSWQEVQFEIDEKTGVLIRDDNNLYLPGADGDLIEGLQRKPSSEEIERILKIREDLKDSLPDEVKTKIVEQINGEDGRAGLMNADADKIVEDFSKSQPSSNVSTTDSSSPTSPLADNYTIKVEKGGSVWKSARQILENNSDYGQAFKNLPLDKQNVFIDWIKDRVAENPEKFNLTGVRDINKIQIGQQINFKAIFEQDDRMFKTFRDILKEAEKLTAQEINEKLIHKWL